MQQQSTEIFEVNRSYFGPWFCFQVKNQPIPASTRQRPVSDGVMYGNYNERRIEYEEVLLSERTESQYSQSESYLSERYPGYWELLVNTTEG